MKINDKLIVALLVSLGVFTIAQATQYIAILGEKK